MELHVPFRARLFGLGQPTESSDGSRRGHPLPVTWEVALDHLARLPRMYVEPDGSFLWTGISGADQAWQLEGTLYDNGVAVQYVDLRGHCPLSAWHDFLAAFLASFASISLELIETDGQPSQQRWVDGAWLQRLASQGG